MIIQLLISLNETIFEEIVIGFLKIQISIIMKQLHFKLIGETVCNIWVRTTNILILLLSKLLLLILLSL